MSVREMHATSSRDPIGSPGLLRNPSMLLIGRTPHPRRFRRRWPETRRPGTARATAVTLPPIRRRKPTSILDHVVNHPERIFEVQRATAIFQNFAPILLQVSLRGSRVDHRE